MRNESISRWLVRTGVGVFAITILSTCGAAVFGLLGGALCWVLRVERVPIGFLWLTISGAIAGFLTGSSWAIDRIVNWRFYLSPCQDQARRSVPISLNGKALPQITRNELPQQTIECEEPASRVFSCSLPRKSSRWSQ